MLIRANQAKLTCQYNGVLLICLSTCMKATFWPGSKIFSSLPPPCFFRSGMPASICPSSVCVQVPAASSRTLRLRSSRSVCDSPPFHVFPSHAHTVVAAPAQWNVNLAPLVFPPTLISGLHLADGCLYSQVYPAVMQTPLPLSGPEWCPCVCLL